MLFFATAKKKDTSVRLMLKKCYGNFVARPFKCYAVGYEPITTHTSMHIQSLTVNQRSPTKEVFSYKRKKKCV